MPSGALWPQVEKEIILRVTGSRIPTHLWLESKIRELSAKGIGVYVVNKGERMGGLVLLKLSNQTGQCRLLTQQRDFEGVLGWHNIFNEDIIEEKKADEYTARAVGRDPDLWVVEIENPLMDNPFETKD
jgi:hypothetical protein